MSGRDNFPKSVIRELALRVGNICSNPKCSAPTSGPDSSGEKAITVGEAAHITAASNGGARFDKDMSSKERKSIGNGIWLCGTCATLIDKDEKKYSITILQRWKLKAEQRAQLSLERGKIKIDEDFSDTVLLVIKQDRTPGLADLKSPGKMRLSSKVKHRSLVDVDIPLMFNSNLDKRLIAEDLQLITLCCQNQGSHIDKNVRVEVNFVMRAIDQCNIDNQERVVIAKGGGKGTSVVNFYLKNILPNEVQIARIIAKKNIPYEIKLWTNTQGYSDEIYLLELVHENL